MTINTKVSPFVGKPPQVRKASKSVTIDPKTPAPSGKAKGKANGRAFAKKSGTDSLSKAFEKLTIDPSKRALQAPADSPSLSLSSPSLSHKSREQTPQAFGRRVTLEPLKNPLQQGRRHTFDHGKLKARSQALAQEAPQEQQSQVAKATAQILPIKSVPEATLQILRIESQSSSQLPGEITPQPMDIDPPTRSMSDDTSQLRALASINEQTLRPQTAPTVSFDASLRVEVALSQKKSEDKKIEYNEQSNQLFVENVKLAEFSELPTNIYIKLSSATHISLKNCTLTEKVLIDILKLPKLEYLDLSGTKLQTEDGRPLISFHFSWLKYAPGLHTLKLGSWGQITFDAMDKQEAYGNLRVLDLTNVKTFSHGLSDVQHFTSLEALSLSRCEYVADDDLLELASLINLRKLYIGGCRRLTADGIAKFQAKRRPLVDKGLASPITTLSLAESTFLDRDISSILAAFKDLKVLSLRSCKNISGSCLQSITSEKIETIDLSNCIHFNNEPLKINYLLALTQESLKTLDTTNDYFITRKHIDEFHEHRKSLGKGKLEILRSDGDQSPSSTEIDRVSHLVERSKGAHQVPIEARPAQVAGANQNQCCVIL